MLSFKDIYQDQERYLRNILLFSLSVAILSSLCLSSPCQETLEPIVGSQNWKNFVGSTIGNLELKFQGDFKQDFKDRVLSACVIKIGSEFSRSDIRKTINNIYALGEVSNVIVDATLKDNKVSISITVVGQIVTNMIYLRGNRSIAEREILEVISLKEGKEYDDSIAEKDVRAIRDLYVSRGYINATVSYTATKNGEQKVDVTFTISEGERPYIRDIVLTGTNRSVIEPEKLIKSMKEVKPGEIYRGSKALEADVRRIEEMYRQREFLTAKVKNTLVLSDEEKIKEYEGVGVHFTADSVGRPVPKENSVVIVINIEQGKRVYIKTNGNKNIKTKEILKAIAIQRMRSVSESVIRRSREDIEKLYKSNGYYMVEVSYSILKDIRWDFEGVDDMGGWKPGDEKTTVKLNNGFLTVSDGSLIENSEVKVDSEIYQKILIRMRIKRNEPSDSPQTSTARLWWAISKKSKKWSEKRSIEFQVILDGQFHDYEIPMYTNDNWRGNIDRLRIKFPDLPANNIDIEEIAIVTEFVPIVFDIKENKQMRISDIKILPAKGNKLEIGEDKIRKQMLTKKRSMLSFWFLKRFFPTGLFNEIVFEEDLRAINALYRDNGYMNPIIDRRINTDVEKGKITVEITIDEGPKTLVHEIVINGENRNALSDKEILSSLTMIRNFNEQNIISEGSQTRYLLVPPIVFREYDLTEDSSSLAAKYADRGYFAEIRHNTSFSRDLTSVSVNYYIDQGKQVRIDDEIVIRGNTRTKDRIIRRELSESLINERVFKLSEVEKSMQRIRDLGLFENVKPETYPIPGSEGLYKLIIEVKERNPKRLNTQIGFSSAEGFTGKFEALHINLAGTGRRIALSGEIGTKTRQIESEYIEPKVFGTDAFGLVNIYPHIEYIEPEYDEVRKGITIGLGWRFRRINTIKLNYVYDVWKYNQKDVDQSTKIGKVETIIQRDSRDNFLNPKKGAFHGLSLEYANPLLGGREKFTKLSLNNVQYLQLLENLVFGFGLKTGYGWGLSNIGSERRVLTPILFRMRDYPTPRGFKWGVEEVGSFLLNGSLETKFLLHKWVGLAVFIDSGYIYQDIDKFDVTSMRTSVGIGLRLITPIGPLRLDYGYPIYGDGKRRIWPELAFGSAF